MKKTMTAVLLFLLTGIAAGAGDEYILKPGDVIFVSVVEHEEFSAAIRSVLTAGSTTR